MTQESILVTGGAGFIGSHTVKHLKKRGYRPIVLDNLSTGNRSALLGDPFHEGNIADRALVTRIVREHKPSGVILFAGHAYVGESTVNPRKYYENNIASSLAFLGTLLDEGVDKLVFSSSCSIYGNQDEVPLREDLPKAPLSPYAETKEFFERILGWYSKAYAFESACLRYFNAAGSDAEGEIGESHIPETHLIPLAILAALGGEPLVVFGDDYPTPDGTAVRDYIHVTDLASAHEKALAYLIAGGKSFAANVGTGKGHSIREVIAAVEKISGRHVPHSYGPRREGDATALVADPRHVQKILGWRAEHSSLDQIVENAWSWLSKTASRG